MAVPSHLLGIWARSRNHPRSLSAPLLPFSLVSRLHPLLSPSPSPFACPPSPFIWLPSLSDSSLYMSWIFLLISSSHHSCSSVYRLLPRPLQNPPSSSLSLEFTPLPYHNPSSALWTVLLKTLQWLFISYRIRSRLVSMLPYCFLWLPYLVTLLTLKFILHSFSLIRLFIFLFFLMEFLFYLFIFN